MDMTNLKLDVRTINPMNLGMELTGSIIDTTNMLRKVIASIHK